ncbi:MAG: M20/M25/M40 family metallo-hydrolase [Chloroflexi bacterium]|nr:M20/M25/M40 family metallo-hydrolase [Chloroflexota bacterium]
MDTGFSAEESWRHVERLASEIGSRSVGAPAVDKAADYIADQLASYGYQVERQSFPFQRYIDQGSQITVERPHQLAIGAGVMQLSAQGEVTAALVDVGLGRPSDFDAKTVKGKVALARRGGISFDEKAANAMAAGAIGLIVSNNEPGLFEGSLRTPVSIPVVAITPEDGQRLRALLNEKETVVRLAVKAHVQEGTTQNVVGTRPGDRAGAVIVGGHYDSVMAGPGANDNASGVGVALEVARALAARDYPYTVKVIAFSAEEIGHLGSRHYVSALSPKERQSIVAMINLDMVGVGNNLTVAGTGQLVAIGVDAARKAGYAAARLYGQGGGASDHTAFLDAGVPALYITWGPDPRYHSAQDKTHHVQPRLLAATGQIVLDVLKFLSNG